jgi:hypothetical protein
MKSLKKHGLSETMEKLLGLLMPSSFKQMEIT